MGSRAARIAGSRPPNAPMVRAKAMHFAMISGVMRNAKATSLKLDVLVE